MKTAMAAKTALRFPPVTLHIGGSDYRLHLVRNSIVPADMIWHEGKIIKDLQTPCGKLSSEQLAEAIRAKVALN